MNSETTGPSPSKRGHSMPWKWLGWVVFPVVCVWLAYWIWGDKLVPGDDIAQKGQFGDMFGALNAFFSALAFSAIVITLGLQIRQIREQHEEIQRTEELRRKSAEALQKQAEANELSAKLSALDCMIQAISRQIEHCDEKSPELPFLRIELDEAIGDLRVLLKSGGVFRGFPDSCVNDEPLVQDDVPEIYAKHIPYLDEESVRPAVAQCYSSLIRHGVDSRRRLEHVLSERNVVKRIEELYVQELFRSPRRPLDPLAVAVWVVMLFKDPTIKKLEEIRRILKSSPEWRDKHQFGFPPFHFLTQRFHSQSAAYVAFRDNDIRGFDHFPAAKSAAENWIKENPTSGKPRLFYFNFDSREWEEFS